MYLEDITQDEMIQIHEGELALIQMKNLSEDYFIRDKNKLYGESVGAIMLGLLSFAKSAMILFLKLVAGIKIAIVALIGIMIGKFIKKITNGTQTDIYGGGGGSYTGNTGSLGVPIKPIKAHDLKRIAERAKLSIKKVGKLRDGAAQLGTYNKIKSIIQDKEVLDDDTIEQIALKAVSNLRTNVDITSKGSFVLSEDIAGLIVDMVSNNIDEDKSFDGISYSSILSKNPLYDLTDREAIVNFLDVYEDIMGDSKDSGIKFMGEAISNIHPLMMVCIVNQLSIKLIMEVCSEIDKVETDDEIEKIFERSEAIAMRILNDDYSEILKNFPPKMSKIIANSMGEFNIATTESKSKEIGATLTENILNITGAKAMSNIDKLMDFTNLSKISKSLSEVKFEIVKNAKDALKWIEFKRLKRLEKDDGYAIYDIVFSDNTERGYAILRVLQKVIEEQKLNASELSKSLSEIEKQGKLVRDKVTDFNVDNDIISKRRSLLQAIMQSTIDISTSLYKIIEIFINYSKNAQNPIYRKIHEDISIAVQSFYYLSALQE